MSRRSHGIYQLFAGFGLCVIIVLISLCTGVDASEVQPRSERYYVGTIGEKLAVQLDASREGQSVSGSYFYEAYGRSIRLNGPVDRSGRAKLIETSPAGNKTGELSGQVDASADRTPEWTWSDPSHARSLPVHLTCVAEAAELRIEEPRLQVTTRYPRFVSDTPLAEFANATLQRRYEKLHTEDVAAARNETAGELSSAPYRFNTRLAITWYSDDLIFLSVTRSTYTGGAHANLELAGVGFYLDHGRPTEVTLDSLFSADSDYVNMLSRLCVSDLKRQNASLVAEGSISSFTKEKLQSFYVGGAGITIQFQPYEVGSYAEGSFDVVIPFKTLTPIAAPHGPLSRFLPRTRVASATD